MALNHGLIFSRNRSDVEVIKVKIDLYTENSRQPSTTLLVYLMQQNIKTLSPNRKTHVNLRI